MTCSRVQNLLSAYIDKELSKDDYLRIRTHITTCSICNKAFEELMEVKELFDNLETVEPPNDMWLSIRTTILTGDLLAEQSVPQRKPWWNMAFNLLKVVVPAAVIGIVVALPLVSQITGVNVADRLFNKNSGTVYTVDETFETESQTALSNAKAKTNNPYSSGLYTPAVSENYSKNSYGQLIPLDLGNSSTNVTDDSFYLGNDNNIIFNDIITFFNSVYGLTIEIEITP